MAKASSPQRARERALFRYRNALERGDFDTVAEVLQIAERDSALVRMIAEFHELDDAPPKRAEKPQRGITTLFIRREPSPNGWPPKTDTMEEESDMLTISQTTLRGHSVRLQFFTAVAAAIILVVLGTILIEMANRYVLPHRIGLSQIATPTATPIPVGCQLLDSSDAHATSVRLAAEAQALLDGDTPDTELTTLLAVCALQTANSLQADKALQLSLIAANGIPEFPSNEFGVLNTALFSPDGQSLLVSRGDGARLWDIESAAEIRTFVPGKGGPIAFSPDGRSVLGFFDFDVARLWDTQTGETIHDFSAGADIIDLAFSPDGTRIALSLTDGIQIWRVDTATQERSISIALDPSAGEVAFSPNGRAVLVGDRNSPYSLHLLDVETGTELRTFTGLRDFANMAVFSPDGRYVLAGGDTADRRALLWDAETGEELHIFSGYINDVTTVAFSPDSRYALVGSADSTLGLWDAETGAEVRRFGSVGNLGYVWSVGFSPDGKTILIGTSDERVRLWPASYPDMIALACERVTRDFTANERAAYGLVNGAPTCEQFAVQSAQATATDAPTIAACQPLDSRDAQGTSVQLADEAQALLDSDSPDTELAMLLSICGLQTAYSTFADTALQQAMSRVGAVQKFEGNDNGGVFSPDGRYLLIADDTVLRLLDLETGEPVREFVGHTGRVTALAFSPDGRYALSGGFDHTARMWDVETGQEIQQFVGHTDELSAVAFSPDGRTILTAASVGEGTTDNTARLWDAVTGEEIRTFTGHRMPIFGAAFSPDGRYVATSSWDTTVRLWDAATGEELRQYPPHNTWAAQVAFSSDGQELLNSGTYVVRRSDVETGETIREYQSRGSRALEFPSFSPDGRYVLASDRDNVLALLWDADTTLLVRQFDGRAFNEDANRMFHVNFSPDGRTIAMGVLNDNDSPYQIWLWDTDYRDTIARACDHLTRDFTPEERAQYGLSDGTPTCPQFGENAVLPPGMTPIPTQPIPVWTPLPAAAS